MIPDLANSISCYGNLTEYHYYKEGLLYVKIQNGKEIRFKRLSKFSEQILSNLLLNVPIGYCLYQNLKLVLHGSAIKVGAKSIAFVGESGSGKSTMAASLIQFGTIITEDVCYIELNKFDKPKIFSMPSYLKLNAETIDKLSLRFSKTSDIPFDRRNRFYCHLNRDNFTEYNDLDTIYLLKWGNQFKIHEPDIRELFSFLNLCTFNCYPIDSCKKSQENLFQNLSMLLKKVKFYILERNKEDSFDNNIGLLKHISD